MTTTSERLTKLETKQKIILLLVSAQLGVDVLPVAGAKLLGIFLFLF